MQPNQWLRGRERLMGEQMAGGRRFLGTETSEAQLLAGVAKGELDALGEIYRRHGAAVLAAARKATVDAETAETITAEVFVELWDAPASATFGGQDGLRAYLVTRVVARIGAEKD
jgi:DNA-directed RNA polymerase specialized sigma24 family protein